MAPKQRTKSHRVKSARKVAAIVKIQRRDADVIRRTVHGLSGAVASQNRKTAYDSERAWALYPLQRAQGRKARRTTYALPTGTAKLSVRRLK